MRNPLPLLLAPAAAMLSVALCLTLIRSDASRRLVPRLADIPPGSFLMGSEAGGYDFDESPVHPVEIAEPFRMGVAEVTNREYELFRPSHRALRGSEFGLSVGDDEAAAYVSWQDAADYCRWLSRRTGRHFRLPTEAEWEYACRAGSRTAYHYGDSLPAAFCKNQRTERNLAQVDLRAGAGDPNAFGLYDMHGNLEEWCLDWYGPYQPSSQRDPSGPEDGIFKVTRGGSHNTPARFLRSAARSAATPDDLHSQIGFRIVEVTGRSRFSYVREKLSGVKSRGKTGAASMRRVVALDSEDPRLQSEDGQPLFAEPLPYIIPPEDGSPFYSHNHQPAVCCCPGGDLLAIWFSCDAESGREMVVLSSRFHDGRWSAASLFFKVPDRNMTGSALCLLPDGRILHLNGVGNSGDWQNLALCVHSSGDGGFSWSAPKMVTRHGRRHQVIAGTLVLGDGSLVQCCDAGPGGDDGTAVLFSGDGARSWIDPWDGSPLPLEDDGIGLKAGPSPFIGGIHAGLVELRDGSLMALGRGNPVLGRDGRQYMPKSISRDRGASWTCEASPFPPIGGGQRLVLMRLSEGPLFLLSFTGHPSADQDKLPPAGLGQGSGAFVALSYDDGETWPVRRLLSDSKARVLDGGAWTGEFLMDGLHAEPKGYFAAAQTPDGVIHLLSSRLHYRINLAWIEELRGATAD